jgi:hypothetical protein
MLQPTGERAGMGTTMCGGSVEKDMRKAPLTGLLGEKTSDRAVRAVRACVLATLATYMCLQLFLAPISALIGVDAAPRNMVSVVRWRAQDVMDLLGS